MSASKITLTVISGPVKDKVFEFDAHDTFIFGRGRECHCQIAKDGLVSRHHFLLEINPPDAVVRDLGSLNGTEVNGVIHGGRAEREGIPREKIAESVQCQVKDGDTITVGNTSLCVSIENPIEGEFPVTIDHVPELPPQSVPESQDDQPATIAVIGYEIGKKLGYGAMGTVYRGRRLKDGFPMAIKVLHPRGAANDKTKQMFLREVEVLKELQHENIVNLIESGATDDSFYFVMDYCNGDSLGRFAKRRGGKLTIDALGPLAVQCLRGLAYAHENGFVHRDLKPANILLHQDRTEWIARLGDFGLAKQLAKAGLSGMTMTGHAAGTFEYMPTEQLTDFKNVLPVSDIWSMAATLYVLLTEQNPRNFSDDRDPVEVILRDEAVPIRERDATIPAAIADVIDRGLLTDVSKRYQDAKEMLHAFENCLRNG